MKILNQGQLYPKLEVSRVIQYVSAENRIESAVGGEHSRKEPFRQLVNSYSEHMNPRQYYSNVFESSLCKPVNRYRSDSRQS
jgi:hypothetical protein